MAVIIDQDGKIYPVRSKGTFSSMPTVTAKHESGGGTDLRSLFRTQKITLGDIPDAPTRFAVPRIDHSGLPIVNLSSSHYGALNVNSLVVGSLQALTAFIGNLIINKGGSLSSGETAYGVGAGFWLGTNSSGNPQFSIQDTQGNFININASGTNVLSISSTGISGALTSKQVDDAGLGNTSIWLNVISTPNTIAGYGITDAQGILPNASGVGQVLQRDNGGSPYFSAKYGSEMNSATSETSATTNLTSASYITVGNIIGIPKPSAPVNAIIFFSVDTNTTSGTESLGVHIDYSLDGGSTWTTQFSDSAPQTTVWQVYAKQTCVFGKTCTGDFQVRVQVANVSAINTIRINTIQISVLILPNSNFYLTTGPVTSTVPATGAGSCTATYPATTCTASVNVMVTPGGGTPPYTFAWSVVSGTGTITSGATSQTCTVSDTETATTGGATHNTTIKCVVTDSVLSSATSGNDVITNTFTLVYSPITASVSPSPGTCSTSICGQTCTAVGTATANASGGNGSYTYSWSVVSGTGTIVSGSTSQTVTIHDSKATSQFPYTHSSTVMQCSVNDTRGTGAVTPQGTVGLTFKCPNT